MCLLCKIDVLTIVALSLFLSNWTIIIIVPVVDILLKATGDAPILKKRKWAVEGDKDVGFVINFVKQLLKLEKHENLVNN